MLDLTPVSPGMTVDDYINGGGGMSEPSITPDLWVYEWDTYGGAVHMDFHPGQYNGRKCDRAVAYFKVPDDAIRAAVEEERERCLKEIELRIPAEGIIRATLQDVRDAIKRGAA